MMLGLFVQLLISTASADDVPVASRVSEVTVYLDRARVVRTVSIDVPAGRTDLVFDGLPLALLPASLSAEGEGNAGATLTGIDMRPERGVEDRDARVATLRTERRTWEDRIREQSDVIARVQADIRFVTSLQPRAPQKLEEGLFLADDAAAQLAGVSRSIGTDLLALYREQRAAEQKIRDYQKEVDRIDREIGQLQSAPTTDSTRVAVGLDAARAGRVTVRLQYVVTGAGWQPHWDARFKPSDGSVKLDLSGEVYQQTGEDWEDVRLILSTAQPQQGTAPPQLTPFVLYEGYGYPVPMDGSGYGAGTGMAYGGAVVSDRVTAVEFATEVTEDVPADGTVRRVYLDSFDVKGDTLHQVVARRVEAAFLTVRAKNDGDFAWMAGSLSSYMGSAYVGEGWLNVTAPGAEADLSFGIDDRVRVERTRLASTSAEAKPLQNRDRQSYGWKTTVTNRTGKPIDLRVTDQVPVSREAAFEVHVETTPEIVVPEGTGVFTWEAKLAEGKSADFVLEYEVTWPQGDPPVLME